MGHAGRGHSRAQDISSKENHRSLRRRRRRTGLASLVTTRTRRARVVSTLPQYAVPAGGKTRGVGCVASPPPILLPPPNPPSSTSDLTVRRTRSMAPDDSRAFRTSLLHTNHAFAPGPFPPPLKPAVAFAAGAAPSPSPEKPDFGAEMSTAPQEKSTPLRQSSSRTRRLSSCEPGFACMSGVFWGPLLELGRRASTQESCPAAYRGALRRSSARSDGGRADQTPPRVVRAARHGRDTRHPAKPAFTRQDTQTQPSRHRSPPSTARSTHPAARNTPVRLKARIGRRRNRLSPQPTPTRAHFRGGGRNPHEPWEQGTLAREMLGTASLWDCFARGMETRCSPGRSARSPPHRPARATGCCCCCLVLRSTCPTP